MNISRIIDIVHNPILDSRLKKDGVTRKSMKMLGIGFLNMVDHLFWNLPFAVSSKAYQCARNTTYLRKIGITHFRRSRQSTRRTVLASSLSMDGRHGSRIGVRETKGKAAPGLQAQLLIWIRACRRRRMNDHRMELVVDRHLLRD